MERRRHIRYGPDEDGLVYITPAATDKGRLPALLVNESFSGCSLVMAGEIPCTAGEAIRLQVGRMEVSRARVCWVRQLDEGIIKLGIEYDDLG